MEETAKDFIGQNGWLFLAGVLAIVFNSIISSSAQGLMVWWSKQYQPVDIVIVNGRKARIVRIGMRETVFYFEDKCTKLTVPNEAVRGMGIEKSIKPMDFGASE